MQRSVRRAWIAGLSAAAAGVLVAGCAGTPAPRPRVEDASVRDAVDPPRPAADDWRPPVPRRVERTSQPRNDRETSHREASRRPGEPTPPRDEPSRPPVEGSRPPAPERVTKRGGRPPAKPRDHRHPTDPPSRPRPPGQDADCPEPDVLTEQADLVQAAATRPSPVPPGFAGLALSAPECRIDLWWNGPVPSSVVAAIEPIDGLDGVHVATHDAAYSAAELAAAANALTTQRFVTLPDRAPVVAALDAVTPRHDGAGIDVEVSLERGATGARLTERIATSLAERAGVPVFVEVVATPPAALDQLDDPRPSSSPRGDRSYHPIPGRPGAFAACTTGFGVRAPDGEGHWVLTADHCTSGADGPALDGSHEPIGAVTEHRPALDSTRIAVDDTGGDAVARGVAANYPGKSVCQGGATSGEVCDLVIRQVDRRQWSEALGTYVRDVVEAERTNGGRAARPGDSGASVYRITSAGDVEAQGILVMGHTAELPGSPIDTIYYVDIRALLDEWDAELDGAPHPTDA